MLRYTDLFQSARVFRAMMNLWPPLWGQGIRIVYISPDFREVRTRLFFRWYNRGNPGTSFGGALFSMTDPFYAIMLLKNLGDGFTVWDQAATIAFLRPARETVEASFILRDEQIDMLHQRMLQSESCSLDLPVAIDTLGGLRVASVTRTLHVQRIKKVGHQDTDSAE